VPLERVNFERIPTADLVEESKNSNNGGALSIGISTPYIKNESRNTAQSINNSQDSNPLNKFQKVGIPTLNSMEPIKLQRFSFDKGGKV